MTSFTLYICQKGFFYYTIDGEAGIEFLEYEKRSVLEK